MPEVLGAAGPAPPKRSAADAGLHLPSGSKRIELGEDLPDEVAPEQIEQMLDQADDVHIEAMNEGALKRMVLQLERKVKRNQEMRIKHADEPEKFLKSEVDLDEEVKRFTILATHPDLYGTLVQLEGLPLIVGLLNHTNADIAVDVFEVLSELTDPDVIAEVGNPEDFVKALFETGLAEMSVDVLLRINEDNSEEESQAVSNCLQMIENLADINPTDSCARFAQVPRLLPWLIKRVRAQGAVDYNRVYASEILGIILQNSPESREAMVKQDGVDKLLRGIAVYRKRDPADSEESEFVQNMFDSLCSLMLLKTHQVAFGKVQGLELMIRMMRERKFATNLALRLADHSMRHCAENCQIFVEKTGLPVLFSMFMRKGPKEKSKSKLREVEEHVASVIQSLCRYCTGTAVARVLNKFTENRFEKLERLLEAHEEYAQAVRQADSARSKGEMQKIDRELEVDEEEQLFLDRCDAGLFTLQQVDIVIVRLANMGNRQVADEIGKLLDVKGISLDEVQATIDEFVANLDDSAREERDELRGFTRALIKKCGGTLPEDEPRGAEKAEKRAAYASAPGASEKEDPRRTESAPEKKEKKDEKKEEKKDKKDKKEKKEKKA